MIAQESKKTESSKIEATSSKSNHQNKLNVTFGSADDLSHRLATMSREDARVTIEDAEESIKFNPDQIARNVSLLSELKFQNDSKLLGGFSPKEIGFLNSYLSNDKQFYLLLEAVSFKTNVHPEYTTKDHEEVVEHLKVKFAYLSTFTLERQMNFLKTSKDLAKVYYILTILNFAKLKTKLYKGNFNEIFWRLIYTTETKGWIQESVADHLLKELYFYNELFCFGINFIFHDGKTLLQQTKRSLTKMMLNCVSTSMTLPLPTAFTDHLFHNCINLSYAIGSDKLLGEIEERMLSDTGVVDVERNCVCPGLRRLHRYLKFGKLD